jgi:hypothetical protein
MVRIRKITMPMTSAFGASAAFGLILSAAALVCPAPAHAADDEVSADQKFLRGIMEGLGFRREGEENINYRERSPLVIPPSRALPPPERSDAAIANNPAWPKDPDIERRRAQAAAEKGRNISDEREREQNPLRPDQLNPGGRPKKKQARTDDGYEPPASGFGSQIMPSELGFKNSMFGNVFNGKKEESAKFTGEPPRSSLTDPPPGYQTPSPEQPYGVGKNAAPKATDYYTTHSEPVK